MTLCGQLNADVLTATPPSAYVPPGRTLYRSVKIDEGAVFSGFGACCLLPNGHALAMWARSTFVFGNSSDSIYTSVSTDLGATWSTPALVLAGNGSHYYDPVSLVTLVSGKVLAIIRNNLFAYSIVSADNGATWGTPVALPNGYNPAGAISLGGGAVQLPDNSVLCPMYGSDDPSQEPTYLRFSRSTNDGTTWADTGVTLSSSVVGYAFSEPWLCTLDDGRLLLTIRHDPVDSGNPDAVFQAYSSDHGATWTTPAKAISGTGASPAAIQTPELDTWMTSRDLLSGSGPVAFSSPDRGTTWGFPTPLAASTTTYEYGQWAYIGASGADGSLACVVGIFDPADSTNHTNLWFCSFTKKN